MTRDTILLDIVAERIRQDRLCREGRFLHTLADLPADGGLSPEACLAVVAEEFGEVAEVVADKLAGKGLDTEHLRTELVQLAACCVAWVEQLDEVTAPLQPYRDSELPRGALGLPRAGWSYPPASAHADLQPEPTPLAESDWILLAQPDMGGAL